MANVLLTRFEGLVSHREGGRSSEHTFTESGDTTTMVDTVEFASPMGPLGWMIDALVLTRHMTRLLTQRDLWLVEALSYGGRYRSSARMLLSGRGDNGVECCARGL